MTFLLIDSCEDRIDAMIESKTLSTEQIQNIIYNEIKVIEDYCSDDIDNILGNKYGCTITWVNGDDLIYW